MKELALHILDIMENSVTAGATHVTCAISEDNSENRYKIRISDDGKGMDAETLGKVQDPFFTSRTTRKVGMGISLFKQVAIQCGGNLEIFSEPGKGTELLVSMQLNHIDRQPLGDIQGVFVQLLSSFPHIQFKYNHTTTFGNYEIDSGQIKEILGDITQINSELRNFIKEMIRENLEEIKITK